MARGEGEVDTRKPGLKSHFVERVVKLPIVHVAWDYAANTYSSIKESNRLVNFTLTNAERSVTFVAGQAKPVVMKFEKQIQVVDELACKGLGTLEEKVPLITKYPDEIIGDTRKLYSSTVYSRLEDIHKYGRDKVKSVTDYGLQKASTLLNNPVVSSVMKSVDGALVITEKYIDYVLPATDDEDVDKNDLKKNDSGEVKNGPLTRLNRMSVAIRRRAHRKLILRVRNFRNRAEDFMNVPVALVAVGQEVLENTNEYVTRIWIILTSDEPDKEKYPENFPLKQLIPVARPVVRPLAAIGSTILDRLHLSSSKKSEANNVANNVNHSPAVVDAVKDNILWVVGLVTSSTHVLPFYVYSWISYFFPKSADRAPEKISDGKVTREENNSVHDQRKEQNHVQDHDTSPSDENGLD